jgi:hypothetical protein
MTAALHVELCAVQLALKRASWLHKESSCLVWAIVFECVSASARIADYDEVQQTHAVALIGHWDSVLDRRPGLEPLLQNRGQQANDRGFASSHTEEEGHSPVLLLLLL